MGVKGNWVKLRTTAAPAGTFGPAGEDLTKEPPRLSAFGHPIEERPEVGVLRAYFEANPPGPGPIRLEPGSTLVDPALFIRSHFMRLDSEGAKRHHKKPFYYRLLTLYFILTNPQLFPDVAQPRNPDLPNAAKPGIDSVKRAGKSGNAGKPRAGVGSGPGNGLQ